MSVRPSKEFILKDESKRLPEDNPHPREHQLKFIVKWNHALDPPAGVAIQIECFGYADSEEIPAMLSELIRTLTDSITRVQNK